jgi:hypothetical protein
VADAGVSDEARASLGSELVDIGVDSVESLLILLSPVHFSFEFYLLLQSLLDLKESLLLQSPLGSESLQFLLGL